jgi:hypothetical protein
MKRLAVIFILFVAMSGYCNLQAGGKTTDNRFVGTWWGSEKDEQVKGVLVKWVQERFSDGKLITHFTFVYEDGSEETSVEKGKWWVQDGLFFEQTEGTLKSDVYSYEIVDPDHIIFRAKKLSVAFENKNYQFVDTRVINDSIQTQSGQSAPHF